MGPGGRLRVLVVITGADVEAHWLSAHVAGAAGYLPKTDLAHLLLPTVRAIAAR